jgi:hypothetical protein
MGTTTDARVAAAAVAANATLILAVWGGDGRYDAYRTATL